MRRRHFLRIGGQAAAGLLVSPLIGCSDSTLVDPGSVQRFTTDVPLAFAPDGSIWTWQPLAHELTAPDGRVVAGFGTGPTQLNGPAAVVVLSDEVLVLDRGNHRVQRFDLGGAHRGSLSADLLYPGGLDADDTPNGQIWVADTLHHEVVCFTRDGALVGRYRAELNGPRGLTLTPDAVHVIDSATGRVVVFDRTGHAVSEYGRGILSRPLDIVVVDGLAFVTDLFRPVLSVFDIGTGRLVDSLPITRAATHVSLDHNHGLHTTLIAGGAPS